MLKSGERGKNKIMIESYFDISYEEALKFLNNLSDSDIKTLLDEYSAKDIENLADAISDTDLIAFGYVHPSENNKSLDNSKYLYNNVEDIEEFLNNLDEDTLDSLKSKYDAFLIEDLAIAITDNDLKNLDYYVTADVVVESVTNTSNMEFFNSNCYTVEDKFEFLEDIDPNINFAVVDKNNYVFAVKDDIDFNRFVEGLDRNLINYCEQLDYSGDTHYDSGIYFQLVPYSFPINKNEIFEDVVINDELNSNIFEKDHSMITDVKDQLLEYYNQLISYLENKGITLDVQDVTLVGSNAGYLYTPESDIDLHIIVNNPLEVSMFDILKNEFDLFEVENPLVIGDSTVEIGIEDGYNTKMSIENPRRYSILTDEWVNDSDKSELYNSDDIELVEGYEEIVDDYVSRIEDIIYHDEFADAVELKKEIRQNRSIDLSEKGALSIGNVVFKELRNNGAYGKLKEYIKTKELDKEDIDTIVEIEESIKPKKLKDFYIKKATNSNLEDALDIVKKYDKELYNKYSDWAEKSSIDDYAMMTNDRKLKHLRDLIHDKYDK